jgi:hypothetical protein
VNRAQVPQGESWDFMSHPAFRIRARAFRSTEIKTRRSQKDLREDGMAYPVAQHSQRCRAIRSQQQRGEPQDTQFPGCPLGLCTL